MPLRSPPVSWADCRKLFQSLKPRMTFRANCKRGVLPSRFNAPRIERYGGEFLAALVLVLAAELSDDEAEVRGELQVARAGAASAEESAEEEEETVEAGYQARIMAADDARGEAIKELKTASGAAKQMARAVDGALWRWCVMCVASDAALAARGAHLGVEHPARTRFKAVVRELSWLTGWARASRGSA